jgi:glycosyltransferase involved in cell wall biosynthesis
MIENKLPLFDFYLLIPYYNNLPGLIRSLESVSYDPAAYALLIVDDGSREALRYEDLSPYLPGTLSVNILRQTENGGITRALNTGLKWLDERNNCKYVARLDCGDLCVGSRFLQQVAFLDKRPDVDLIGSWCIFRDFSTGDSYRYITPTEYKEILRGMHFRNIFIHPTVMWRADVTRKAGVYPENFPHAEDYGFFYEIISRGEAAIIPDDLVICEINPKGLSLYFRREQLKSRIRVVKQYGENGVYRAIGIMKLWLLLMIPYKIVLQTKKIIYGIKHNSVI